MRFRIFGIPTEVQLGFWFIAVFLNYRELFGQQKYLILVWVLSVFVSVMVHELGHAIVMMRYGLRPEITLHMLGGATASPGLPSLTRPQRIFVSFAGPLAGFIVGGLFYGLIQLVPALSIAPGANAGPLAWSLVVGVEYMLWINIGWGLINLLPVLPLDGGHILEDILGPKRLKITATIALVVGGAIVLWAIRAQAFWIAFIFGLASLQSFQRYRAAAGPAQAEPSHAPPPEPEEIVPPEVLARLQEAEAALADDRYDEAGTLAEMVLNENPPKKARLKALTVIGWAHLLEDRAEEAQRVVRAIAREGEADPALRGAVLLALDRSDEARGVLETARAGGDDRKEVVGPLIQILIRKGEVARAAAIALDIVEQLSDDDAREMASIAFAHDAYPWASRLYEALFERTELPDDAYDAARSRALEGDLSGSLVLLRRAVAAGFSDAARVWSDKALEALRSSAEEADELETLLPPP